MVTKIVDPDSIDEVLTPAYGRRALTHSIPKYQLPEHEIDPDTVYHVIHDELMLDGNARLNMATFVTTWMEPKAEKLMTEAFVKNMIDKDEYPQTAAIEERCINIVSNLFHAPD
jgi:glutamate decarboxylase